MDTGPLPWRPSMRSPLWRPATDVYETEDFIFVRVEVAGMREEDFALELEGRALSVRGVRPEQAERRSFHQMEIRFGEFSTEVELPAAVDSHAVEAVYRDGFLLVSLPKTRPQQIQIDE